MSYGEKAISHDAEVAGESSRGRRRLRHPASASSAVFAAWREEALDRLATLLAVTRPTSQARAPRLQPSDTVDSEPALVDLQTEAGTVPAWLLAPPPERSRGAAVVALAGHGRGIDALVDPAPVDGDYHGGVARKLQDAGFTVLCPELTSFGRRRTPNPSDAENSCQVDAMRGLLTGRPVLGRRVADACAAVAAARGLPWIDPARVAVLGGSGGGAVALFTAALDDQIPVAVVANYLSSYADSLCSVPHCICNAVPDLLTWFEMVDVAALLAPRGLIIEAGVADPIFPIAATRAAHAELVDLWAVAGGPAPELVVTEAGHQFLADEAIAALITRLSDPSPTANGKGVQS
jgi:dienelactone hydrolase